MPRSCPDANTFIFGRFARLPHKEGVFACRFEKQGLVCVRHHSHKLARRPEPISRSPRNKVASSQPVGRHRLKIIIGGGVKTTRGVLYHEI
jgi:hypothetical protein